MRTITVEKKIFTIDDAKENEALLERILDRNREIAIHDDWSDFKIEELTTELDSRGYYNTKISFSGFYSQGDGASFTADIDMEKCVDRLLTNGYKKRELQLIKNQIECSVVRIYSRYYHENTVRVSIQLNETGKKRIDEFLNKISEDLVNKLENEIEGLCLFIYKELKEEYEYLVSDDFLIQYLAEDEFLENGTIYN